MNKSILNLTIALSALFIAVSCNETSYISDSNAIPIDLRQTDCKPIEDRIQAISLVEFEIDDSWVYVDFPYMTKTANSYVFLNSWEKRMLIYSHDRKKIMDRKIEGRGPGELLRIDNVFSIGDTVCIYDGGMHRLLYYDDNGKYLSKWNPDITDDELYRINHGKNYIGLSTQRNEDYKYVAVYDNQGNMTSEHLPVPAYMQNLHSITGPIPNSFLYKDTVRFYRTNEYYIYSATANSCSTTYQFIPNNPIPQSLLAKYDSSDDVKLLRKVLKGGYDCMFQGVVETDRYLTFVCIINGEYKNFLFDKKDRELYRTDHNAIDTDMTTSYNWTLADIWRDFITGFSPSYAEGNDLYGQLHFYRYSLLKEHSDVLDDRLKSLLNSIEAYKSRYDVQDDYRLIIKLSLTD